MNTYYSVVYMIDEAGNTSLFMGDSINATSLPLNTYKNTELGEVWVNWFSDKSDAKHYLKEQI